MSILTRILTILETINTFVPVSFEGKPYKANYQVSDDLKEVLIVCHSTATSKHLHTFTLSEHDHWSAEIAAEDMVTELNEIISPE